MSEYLFYNLYLLQKKTCTFHVRYLEHTSHKDFIMKLSGRLAAYRWGLFSSVFKKYAFAHIPAKKEQLSDKERPSDNSQKLKAEDQKEESS